MPILDRALLDRAVEDGVLTPAQADALWARAGGAPPATPASAARHPRGALAVALGALAAAAGAALLVVAWERLGAPGGLAVALAEGAALATAALALERHGLPDAAGLLAALCVGIAPVAMRALQAPAGVLERPDAAEPPITLGAWVSCPAFPPAAAAVVAALVTLRLFTAPALSAVLVAALWGTVMSAAPVVLGPAPTWPQHAALSVILGVAALVAGVAVDGRTVRDHAGWLYLSGLAASWGAVTTLHADTTVSLALGAGLNAALVLVSFLLRRRVFAVVGGVGLAGVVGHVAVHLLDDPVVPFASAAIALALVAAALLYERLVPPFERRLPALLPDGLRRVLPPVRR